MASNIAKLKAVDTAKPSGPTRRPNAKEASLRAPASVSSTQRIVASITTAIAERKLRPGTKLSEQKIADLFKVSRTLVRQALNQLSRDQLVVLEPSRGAFVSMPSVDEAREVFEVRRVLEADMTRKLCPMVTDAQIAELRAHLRAEKEALFNPNVTGRTQLLADFHVVLSMMLGNTVLTKMLSELLTRSSLIALMYQSTLSAIESQEEHVAIVNAFEARDVKTAVRLTIEHLDHLETTLRLDPFAPDLSQVLRV
ncbi:GntR family transcriptional regulator [Rhodoferax sp. PAMC 29310]|uniref:GntR family transcriptional regulator n=1 Tax=Rhodoferax sp. PAMC 29310 TaxID=2822760 RepID=UPI001B322FC1|nr:GntR family transcriptional regulator [Rhodoferax sp. PAMC 29310]